MEKNDKKNEKNDSKEELKFWWGLLRTTIVGMLILNGIFSIVKNLTGDEKKESKTETKTNLFMGYSSDNFNIKTALTESTDGDTITKQKVLKNVQWAQLKLYPTIGCTHPSLFYLADNNQEVQRIEVDQATVIE